MRKIIVQVEGRCGMENCQVYLPDEFVDNPVNRPKIKDALTAAFDQMELEIMSIQEIWEQGIELGDE